MAYIGFTSVILSIIGAIFLFFPGIRMVALIISIISLLLGVLGIYLKSKKKEKGIIEISGTTLSAITIILYIAFLFI